MKDNCFKDSMISLLVIIFMGTGLATGTVSFFSWAGTGIIAFLMEVTWMSVWMGFVYAFFIVAGGLATIQNFWRIKHIPSTTRFVIGFLWGCFMIACFRIRLPHNEEGLMRMARTGNGECSQDHNHIVLPYAIRKYQNKVIRRRLEERQIVIDGGLQALLAKPVRVTVLR